MTTTNDILQAKALLNDRSTVWAIDRNVFDSYQQSLCGGVSAEIAAVAPRQSQRESGPTGIGVLPLNGLITYGRNILTTLFGGTALVEWRERLQELVTAKNVKAILLPINSPGGTTAGVMETAKQIRTARQAKPIVAVANPYAASAAFWIASQASRLLSLQSGMIGSVGVFVGHTDVSEAERRAGIKTTYISSTPEKTELASEKPLSKSAETYLRKQVDATYRQFVGDVAAGRKTTGSNVRTSYGRGRMLDAPEALQAGMIDGLVDDPGEAVQVIGQLVQFRREAFLRREEVVAACGGEAEYDRIGREIEAEKRAKQAEYDRQCRADHKAREKRLTELEAQVATNSRN